MALAQMPCGKFRGALLLVATASVVLSFAWPGATLAAEPTVEVDELLEVLAVPARVSAWRAQVEARGRLRHRPGDLSTALPYVRLCVDGFRIDGDPRALSHAEAALKPWWDLEAPPAEALFWRAQIRQSRHLFADARRDLEILTRERPEWAQPWLTLSTMLVVMGELDEARVRCRPLRELAGNFVFTVADASVAGLSGEAEASRHRLRDLLARPTPADPALRAWAFGVLAEICDRLGHSAEAEQWYRAACATMPHDSFAAMAWADFLLSQRRHAELVAALRTRCSHHGLLLRWLCAKARLGEMDAPYIDGLVSLRAAELTADARGETGHSRDHALMHLELLDDPPAALERARRNWETQREPIDARLLVACAHAAGQPGAAGTVRVWRNRYRIQDRALDLLISALPASP